MLWVRIPRGTCLVLIYKWVQDMGPPTLFCINICFLKLEFSILKTPKIRTQGTLCLRDTFVHGNHGKPHGTVNERLSMKS